MWTGRNFYKDNTNELFWRIAELIKFWPLFIRSSFIRMHTPWRKFTRCFIYKLLFKTLYSCLSSFNTMILVPLCTTGKVILTVTKFRDGLRIARTCNQTNTNNIFPNYLTVKGCNSFHILQEQHSLPTGQQILL